MLAASAALVAVTVTIIMDAAVAPMAADAAACTGRYHCHRNWPGLFSVDATVAILATAAIITAAVVASVAEIAAAAAPAAVTATIIMAAVVAPVAAAAAAWIAQAQVRTRTPTHSLPHLPRHPHTCTTVSPLFLFFLLFVLLLCSSPCVRLCVLLTFSPPRCPCGRQLPAGSRLSW